ncbi:DASH family cryptochrome [Ulvibacterium marinum]|uniref:Cryptochrome DASH n=1 Tax=Ulvibacterium marinum TaxID=2419782 RepID=A0A3B0C1Z3_9FLAO|nr:DASH family cryptochrome [Ulvibacterium marinum]RKN78394.1 DASH family cryptochrome [Ulvibacterium marinum]
MNNLVWFRNDLRVRDNISLAKACSGNQVLGIYCFDPVLFRIGDYGFKKTERFRARFLIETIIQLKDNLKKLNIPLFVYVDNPEKRIPKFIGEHDVHTVFLQKEWTQEENETRDAVVAKVSSSVNFEESYDQFLFHPDDIPYVSFQQIPRVFTKFRKKCETYTRVRPVLESPKAKPSTNLIENNTVVPSLRDLGLSNLSNDTRTAFPFQGGETNAQKRVQDYFWETQKLAFYKKTRNGLVGQGYSSKLSPWLANGSISARTIYWEVKEFERTVKKNQDTYWLVFELIWRDFFKYVSLKHGNQIFRIEGILNKKYDWKTSKKITEQWISGQTEDPFINANMREIARTGWMSNRGRQNVASFWSRVLEQDWRIGAAYFESMLLDYDVHSNWGNWMYNSGVGNDPRNRIFNSKRQAERYDPNGKFQALWLQETLF